MFLSPMLFNIYIKHRIYINDLAVKIDALEKGVMINNRDVSISLFADVLLSANQENLQCMLNELNIWCQYNKMSINVSKSNINHFRNECSKKLFCFCLW